MALLFFDLFGDNPIRRAYMAAGEQCDRLALGGFAEHVRREQLVRAGQADLIGWRAEEFKVIRGAPLERTYTYFDEPVNMTTARWEPSPSSLAGRPVKVVWAMHPSLYRRLYDAWGRRRRRKHQMRARRLSGEFAFDRLVRRSHPRTGKLYGP